MQVAHPHSGSSSTWLIPGRIGIWKCWFLRRGENWSTRRKTSRNKGENQQQTQTTYGVDAEIEPGPHWWETSALTTAPPLLCTNGLVYVWQTTKRWVDTAKADLPTNDKGKLGDSWKKKLEILQKVCEILFFPDQDLGRGGYKYLLKYYLALCMVQFYLLPSPRATLGQVQPFRPRSGELFEAVLSRGERGWGK